MVPIIIFFVLLTLNANLTAAHKDQDFLYDEIKTEQRIVEYFTEKFGPTLSEEIKQVVRKILAEERTYKLGPYKGEYDKHTYEPIYERFYNWNLVDQHTVAYINAYIMDTIRTRLISMNFNNEALVEATVTDIQQQLLEAHEQQKKLNDFVGRRAIIKKIHETIGGLCKQYIKAYE
jgi:hypothetical protein